MQTRLAECSDAALSKVRDKPISRWSCFSRVEMFNWMFCYVGYLYKGVFSLFFFKSAEVELYGRRLKLIEYLESDEAESGHERDGCERSGIESGPLLKRISYIHAPFFKITHAIIYSFTDLKECFQK